MRRSGLLLLTVLTLFITAVYARAALPTDEALDKPVTLAVKGEALSDILPMLQEQTGVRLQAARDVADQKATIFIDGKPLRQVMEGLSTLFGYHWTKKTFSTGHTYELWQDEKSRLESGDARRKAWSESWKLALADLTSMLQAVEKGPEYQEDYELKIRSEAAKGSEEAKATLRMFNEATRNSLYAPCAKVFLNLPTRAYDLLGPGVTVRYHTASKEREWLLSDEFARDVSAKAQRSFGANPGAGASAEPNDISLAIELGESGKSVEVRGELTCYLQPQPGMFQSKGYTVLLADRKLADVMSADTSLPRSADSNPADRQVEMTREDLEKAGGRPWQKTGADKLWLTRSDVLSLLHEKLGLQIISDHCSHWDMRSPGVKQTVGEILLSYDKASQVPGQNLSQAVWGWDGAVLYTRAKDPGQASASEIPNPQWRKWESVYKSQGFLGLDEQAEISLLSPEQQVNLTVGRAFMGLPQEGALGPDTLRLYGVLTPEQRKKMFADSLPVSSLTASQIQQLVKLLPENMNSGGIRLGDTPPSVGVWRDDQRLDKEETIDPRTLPVLVRMRRKEQSAETSTGTSLSASVSDGGPTSDAPIAGNRDAKTASEIEYSMIYWYSEEKTMEHLISIPGPEQKPDQGKK